MPTKRIASVTLPYMWIVGVFSVYISSKMIFGAIAYHYVNDSIEDVSRTLVFRGYMYLCGEVASAIATWMLVRYFHKSTPDGRKIYSQLGLVPISAKQIAMSIGAATFLAAVAIWFTVLFPSGVGHNDAITMYTMNGDYLRYAWFSAAVIVAPVVEELICRGVVFSVFLSRTNMAIATLASIVVFLAMHGLQLSHYWTSAVAVMTLSVTCSVVRANGMPLWSAIIIHAFYNFFLVVWSFA